MNEWMWRSLREATLAPRRAALIAVLMITVGGVSAALVPAGRGPSVAVAGVVAAIVALLWNRPQRLALLAGVMFPVQVINGISFSSLEAVHVVLVGVVVVRFRPRLPPETARLVVTFGTLLAALALTRLGFGLVRDPLVPTLRFVALTLAALVAATLLAFRVDAHRSLLVGFVAGTSVSSVVALLQAAGDGWIRTGFYGTNRFPGLNYEAPGLSWQIVVALMVGAAVVMTSGPGRLRRAIGGQMVICTLALLVCGAQGGLAGLAVALTVGAITARRDINWAAAARRTIFPVIAVGLLAGVALATGLGITSITGLAGDPDKGYVNEVARLRSIEFGIENLLAHPLGGAGVVAYDQQYDVRPHFLPLDAAVNTGLLGFLIGFALVGLLIGLLIRGPRVRTPSSLLGMGILSVFLVLSLLTPSGPFAGVERISMLLIGVAALNAASIPFDTAPGHDLNQARGEVVADPAA